MTMLIIIAAGGAAAGVAVVFLAIVLMQKRRKGGKTVPIVQVHEQELSSLGRQPSAVPMGAPVMGMMAPPPVQYQQQAMSAEMISRLRDLNNMKEAGILTEEEFARQKALLIDGPVLPATQPGGC